MQFQYISDNQGHTTAVQLQIPIEEWKQLKEKYNELEEEEKLAAITIPQWHIELVKAELDNLANGTSELFNWDDVKKELKP